MRIVIRQFPIGWCVDKIGSHYQIIKILLTNGKWVKPEGRTPHVHDDMFATREAAETALNTYLEKHPKELADYIAGKLLA